MTNLRYSLAAFLLFCTIAGPIIGLTVKRIWFYEKYQVIHSQYGLEWAGLTRHYGSRSEVLFVVVIPKGSLFQLKTTENTRSQPSSSGISISPHGLYLDGREVSTQNGQRLFVWSKNKTLENVALTPDELAKFDESFVRDIPSKSELTKRIFSTGGWLPTKD
jgi:hypothetical protein